ncbi:MAG: hypothetical protein N2441_09420 [Rhodocyclaceae bacterium]|nr:hypothetical protein [Rhodocyclaceae bacterium]
MASFAFLARHGFRRWYERQLVEAHLWLVSCFLGIVAAAAGVELMSPEYRQHAMGLALMAGGFILALFSWGRYRALLELAERLGEHAQCPACGAYGRFAVLSAGPQPMPENEAEIVERGAEVWLHVRCHRCGERWTL